MLRCHSYFSFLEGLSSPTVLIRAASQLGLPALCLADRNGLSGAIEFYDAGRALNVKPLLGLEFDIRPPESFRREINLPNSSLVVIAENREGWSSLCRLSSSLLNDPNEASPSISLQELDSQKNGLICLTGSRRSLSASLARSGSQSPTQAWLDTLQQIFPGRLYVELHNHDSSDTGWSHFLARIGLEMGLPLAAAHICDYLEPAQSALQKVVSAIRALKPLEALTDDMTSPPGAILLSPSQVQARFKEYPQALAGLSEIIERCDVQIPLGKLQFPQIELPQGLTAIETLRQRAEAGAQALFGTADGVPEIVQSRLNHELGVIGAFGYETLFMIVEDILNHAREIGAPFSSRGSAASSLVAHCLGITSPDPLRLNLYFERFLNPARAKPPDIDTDLCSQRRDEVIDYVYERFGRERVAMVCTINRFRRRSALREVAKAYGLSTSEISNLADSLPQQWWSPADRAVLDQDSDPYKELRQQYPDIKHQQIFNHAGSLIGIPHHLSVHPGGIVISPGRLDSLAPTLMAAKGIRITQFDLEGIDRLGLVKIDLLGIRGLSVLGDVASQLKASSPPLAVYDEIPPDDPNTREVVSQGKTIGCFQIESPGMRLTLKEVQAKTIDDIMVALALYRPGPLTGGLKDAFIRRHRGLEPTVFIHPALAPLLEDTYGVILYQEQVLRIAHELAGLSLADSDLLRRAMSHFDPGKQMVTLKERFVEGAWRQNQVPEAASERIWELMAAFAGYGFPKAHAASYAQIAWRAAWAKTHYPALFMAAVLANWGGYYSQRIYLTEARRLGLTLRPPDVNLARRQFSAIWKDDQPLLVVGLDQVRGLTRRTQDRILNERPFHTIEDFLSRVDPRPLEAVALARCGALASLGSTPAILRRIAQGGWEGGQMTLFQVMSESEPEWSLSEQVAAQEDILGASISAHRLELVADIIQSSGAVNTLEAAGKIGQGVLVAGMRQTWRRSHTVRGDAVYFMSLEDLEGTIDVVITEDVYRRSRVELSDSSGPFWVEGPVAFNQERSEAFIRAQSIHRITTR